MLLPGFRSLALIAMLDRVGLLDKIVRIDSSTDVNDLINGKCRRVPMVTTQRTVCPRRGRHPAIQFDPATYGIQFYNDVLFTDQRHTNRDPALMRRFVTPADAVDKRVRTPGKSNQRRSQSRCHGKTRAHLRFKPMRYTIRSRRTSPRSAIWSSAALGKYPAPLADLGLVPRGMSLASFIFSEPMICGWETW